MGRPEASWEEDGSHEGGMRQRERRKPERVTTSKMGPLRK